MPTVEKPDKLYLQWIAVDTYAMFSVQESGTRWFLRTFSLQDLMQNSINGYKEGK